MKAIHILKVIGRIFDKFIKYLVKGSWKRIIILVAIIIFALMLVNFAAYEFGFFDYWIQQPSSNPEETVQSAIENQLEKEYTLNVEIEEIKIDEAETERVVERYLGSELAEKRGWTEEDLLERFVVVYAKYDAEYDHTKTFLEDGYLEQYFYLLQDKKSGEWTIVDNSSPSTVNRDLLYLDQGAIDGRIHIDKIDELFNENDIDGLEEYMSSLNLKELLETGAELGEESRINSAGMFLAVYIEDKIVIEELDMLMSVISNKRYDGVYRSFILDAVDCSDFYDAEKERINYLKLSIGADKEESEDIRRYALLSLHEMWTYSNDDSGESILLEIFNYINTPSKVRSAALTAMNRTGDPNFKEAVDNALNNFEYYDDLTIRHAMIELAKYDGVDPLEYAVKYGDIVRTTDNEANYKSGIYALGLLGGEESVAVIVSNYGRFGNNRICDYALKSSYNDIKSMIDLNKSKDTILIGIEAARLGKMSIALDALRILEDNSEDEDIVNSSMEAIEYIKANPTVDNYEKFDSEKTESDFE